MIFGSEAECKNLVTPLFLNDLDWVKKGPHPTHRTVHKNERQLRSGLSCTLLLHTGSAAAVIRVQRCSVKNSATQSRFWFYSGSQLLLVAPRPGAPSPPPRKLQLCTGVGVTPVVFFQILTCPKTQNSPQTPVLPSLKVAMKRSLVYLPSSIGFKRLRGEGKDTGDVHRGSHH